MRTFLKGKFVSLRRGILRYLGPVDLTQYFVRGVDFVESDCDECDGVVIAEGVRVVRVDVYFGRRLLNQVGLILTFCSEVDICSSINGMRAGCYKCEVIWC